jgi:hypothetical protein
MATGFCNDAKILSRFSTEVSMSEVKLEALHFSDAPKRVTADFPGPLAAEALALSARAVVAGCR